jgi:putative ABC transport system permease protein
MLAHYLVVALAKFAKTPLTTAANVLTLALGLACFVAAYGIATYWRSADDYHAYAAQTFVIGQSFTPAGEQARPLSPVGNWIAGRILDEDVPEIVETARALRQGSVPVAADDAKLFLNAAIADPGFLRIFDLDFVAGDARRALDEPNSVVLTAEAARRLFGDAPALGQRLIVAGDEEGVVTGVIAPVRQPSFMGASADAPLPFDMLRHWSSSEQGAQLDGNIYWGAFTAYTFVRLPPSLSAEALNARLPDFVERRVPLNQRDGFDYVLEALPVGEITTRSLDNQLFAAGGGGLSAVSALLGLGVLTLVVACVNYASLATAQAAGRAKEVGMRKVLGAGRAHVMTQAWLEATLLVVVALATALGALALAAPVVRSGANVDLLHFMSRGVTPLCVLAGLAAAVALLAGAYPALVQSGVRPGIALRSGRARTAPAFVGRLLVGVQFASASFLLILVTVTQLQRAHLEAAALGPREDPIVILNDLMPIGVDYGTLETSLTALPGVSSVSVVDKAPWDLNGFNPGTFARSPEAGAVTATAYIKSVGYDYFETLNIDVLAGRAFDRERDTTPTPTYAYQAPGGQPFNVVVDAAYAARLGFATPEAAIDELIHANGATAPARIIGVTEPDTTRIPSLTTPDGEPLIAGAIYTFAPRANFGGQHPLVRIDRARVGETIAAITAAWDELAPTVPVSVRFFDDLFEASFRTFARVSQIFMLLAGAAFVIASIGLLGMAVHVTSRRRHEIGVRKVLGSTTLGIMRLLLIDFSRPILVANLLAWPLGYLAALTYLSAFAERAPLTPAPFALSLAITLAIAWAAVIGEVLKAASVRPAEVLRHA